MAQVTTKDGKKAYSPDSDKFSGDARKKVDEHEEKISGLDKPTVLRYYTEDGTPVEPSTIPVKNTVGEADPAGRSDVHARDIPADRSDSRTEEELDKGIERDKEAQKNQ